VRFGKQKCRGSVWDIWNKLRHCKTEKSILFRAFFFPIIFFSSSYSFIYSFPASFFSSIFLAVMLPFYLSCYFLLISTFSFHPFIRVSFHSVAFSFNPFCASVAVTFLLYSFHFFFLSLAVNVPLCCMLSILFYFISFTICFHIIPLFLLIFFSFQYALINMFTKSSFSLRFSSGFHSNWCQNMLNVVC